MNFKIDGFIMSESYSKIRYLKGKIRSKIFYKNVVLLSIKIIKTVYYVNFFCFLELIFTTIIVDTARNINEAVSGLQ
jgi:hypothetical protein